MNNTVFVRRITTCTSACVLAMSMFFAGCSAHLGRNTTATVTPNSRGATGGFVIKFDTPGVAKPGAPKPTFDNEDEPKVSTLKKGQAAPFAGTLFNPPAVAAVIAEIESCEDKIALEKDTTQKKCAAEYELKLANKQAELDSERKAKAAQLEAKEKQIAALNKQISRQSISPLAAGSLGLAGGVILTIVTVAVSGGF